MRCKVAVLGAFLALAGCGHAAQQAAAKPMATVDPEIRALRAQLEQARAERDAALARLHALERHKPAVVRLVVREPAPPAAHPSDSGQPATDVFTTLSTGGAP